MMRASLLVLAVLWFGAIAQAQPAYWAPASQAALKKDPFANQRRPSAVQFFQLNEQALEASLRSVPSEKSTRARNSAFLVQIPGGDGKIYRFRLVEAPVMDASLSARLPRIRSYTGVNEDDPREVLRFSFTPAGFRGMVTSPVRDSWYIRKAERGNNIYMVINSSDLPPMPSFDCTTTGGPLAYHHSTNSPLAFMALGLSNWSHLVDAAHFDYHPYNNADDQKLRIYRLAFAATEEFCDEYGGAGTDAERRAAVRAEQAAQLTIVNGHTERDFGARMVMIDDDDIIYLDNDPFTDMDPDASVLNNEAQTNITSDAGQDNFDIGHLIRITDGGGSYGNAGGIGTVCNNSNKASGFTARGNWDDLGVYSEIMLTHEFGHQMGANHTFTHMNDNNTAQMEPGSGSTIMSYGGNVSGSNVVPLRDHYFHAISIQQVTSYLKAQSCGDANDISNNKPSADAGADFTIPKSTPFKLTGTGSDPDAGNFLTYTWEQMDKVTADDDFPWGVSSTKTFGPAFRSRPPSTFAYRFFPQWATILEGNTANDWEVLPSVTRDLNFRFTVRDNVDGNGQNESDNNVIHVDGDIGPFRLTYPDAGGLVICPGQITVTWDVNGSDELAENVRISLSVDGGISFNTILASTPNDGSADITLPCAYSNEARFMIEGLGNIFFDVSNNNITIGDNTPPSLDKPDDITIFKDEDCDYDASVSITGEVDPDTDVSDNCSAVTVTYTDEEQAGACEGETIIKRTWKAEDACGNKTEKIQTITITDQTPPSFTEPDDITIYKDDDCEHDASVSETGDVTDEADNCDTSLDATFSDEETPGSCQGEVIITRTWTLTDDCGNSFSREQVITVRDTTRPVISNIQAEPCSLWPPNHKMVTVTINYEVEDNCSDQQHITRTLSIASNEPINGTGDGDTEPLDYEVIGYDAHTVSLRAERAGNGNGRIYTIYITATDDCGNTAVDSTKVYVVHNINAPITGKAFKIGSVVAFAGEFWDQPGNSHTGSWTLDETTTFNGTITNEPGVNKNGVVTGSYRFQEPGVYKVRMNITDQKGNTSYATTNGDQEEIVVVYDPSGGYTYGGGWFQSPAGALRSNPAATGIGTYGFAANYFKKSTNPKGETQFVFRVGDFEFNAVNMEYLSMAGNRAQIKGSGKITGLQSGISFIMTVTDGNTTGTPDRIRLKIFNKNTGQVYYDNQPGDSDASDPVTTSGLNSEIVVQLPPQKNESFAVEIPVEETSKQLAVKAMPNPSNTHFTLYVNGERKQEIQLAVFDASGRILEIHKTMSGSYIRLGDNYQPGTYFIRLTQGKQTKELTLVKVK